MLDSIKKVVDNKQKEITLTNEDLKDHYESFAKNEAGFDQLTDINLLRITNTKITALPESVGNFTNLLHLICQNNQLTEVPASIGKLEKLKTLDFSGNQLVSLPAEIGNITSLTALNVSCNKLTTFPNLFKCIHLATLDVSHNELTEFPDIDEKMILFEVNLSNNKIADVPADISILSALKTLDLQKNSLDNVPGNLADCPKLKSEYKIILLISFFILQV